MPICKQCDTCFPNLVKINGETKNLSSRKYCLDCSPFGKHNTVPIHKFPGGIKRDKNLPKVCVFCGKDFVSKTRSQKCASCITKVRRYVLKERALLHMGGKCSRCGYDKSFAALDFHHVDATQKEFHIGGGMNRSWDSIRREIEKCIILCANCHREVHSGEWRTQMQIRKLADISQR